MSTPPLSPAGWYPDPQGVSEQRWWDGGAWTLHVHPALTEVGAGGEEPVTFTVNEPKLGSAGPSVLEDRYPARWSNAKRERRARAVERWLLPGESVRFQFTANGTKPISTGVVVTDVRVFTHAVATFGREMMNGSITSVNTLKSSIVITSNTDGEMTLSSIDADVIAPALAAIRNARTAAPPADALAELARRADENAAATAAEVALAARWKSVTVLGPVSEKSYAAIARLSDDGELPWLVVGTWGAGVLAAFEDRLVIVKTGGMTSFMAGSLGGERATTFFFVDITGIEYNSGFASGVLEILTPSYQGTANKDFWRGSTKSRNADSNDPYVLSNTLPMPKDSYLEFAPHLQKLRARVAEAKRPTAAPAPQGTQSLADELQKLVVLRDAGVLTSDEFAAAKSRLIAGGTS